MTTSLYYSRYRDSRVLSNLVVIRLLQPDEHRYQLSLMLVTRVQEGDEVSHAQRCHPKFKPLPKDRAFTDTYLYMRGAAEYRASARKECE